MKLNEIFDPETRASQLKAMQDKLSQHPVMSHEDRIQQRIKNALGKQHAGEVNNRRERIELALLPLAQKYSGDHFAEFKRDAVALVPKEELQLIDLNQFFATHNPEKKAQGEASWADYGQARANKDPSVFDMGPTGHRNSTGD
jgi:hypothetical protein